MPRFELAQPPLLSRSPLDRAEESRKDTDTLRAGWPTAKVVQIDHRGRLRIDAAGLVYTPASEVAAEPALDAVFLGVRDGHHLWAQRVGALTGELGDLRTIGERLDETELSILTTALAILNWHARASFSAIDGAATTPSSAGWSRTSTSDGHEEFPRTDPAVICLVHDGADRVLLARAPTWPERRFSILAGFVEAGESLEACVVREISEEVGITVSDITYLGSQPWPFPRSVMIGFSAVGDPEVPLQFLDGEIVEAHWFDRKEVRAALKLGDWAADSDSRLLLPGSISIARGMLEAWAAAD
ncbi:NAD(+) diphosphatase [Rhodococcus sp. PAMC28707]|uniref:NAD(+) diphosphatase n=1 Tax=unclassified Rhodococcus (in: high G+C Gram-positive bacteria) TaxID=192944 RepID=UPI00109DA0C2|nr:MULTISPECIES: NAD(+) diphosphatase [unclassified Rhodococcus (in: high G+C Gram-positive bacteria)]QCB50717.1 NAD(+) diphosphatase [Rhodococcus sp. PAMC28705]QCB57591.1 NAD(+) diphosphatase [Rhodococcus sp. PAMC28707]